MSSSLDSLYRNLVGVNEIVCKGCESEAELTNIDENYVAHGTCGKCRGASHGKQSYRQTVLTIAQKGSLSLQICG